MSSSNSTVNDQPQLRYNYIPTEWIGITFLSLFGLSTFVHTVQAFRSRLWWLFPSAIFCGLFELTGWSGRLLSSQNPFMRNPFIIQILCLVVAPTPLVAANFILLGRIIRRLGPQYSRLTPRRYIIIFVSCDIISLVVQGLGAGVSSGTQTSQSQANLGAHIALGGIVFQLVTIIAYCALAAEFLTRYTWDRPVRRLVPVPNEVLRGTADKRLNRMLQAMLVVTIFILIRMIYRVVEFVSGWNGKVISTQWLFNVFDATMICLAMFTLNVFHPGIYLRGDDSRVPSPTSSEGVREDRLLTTLNPEKAV
ncbi:RTA1-domain-containing protein [Russula ochroleuca]|uniref:RTA1-domain-containing protein n=1 Tax=Russula ochroleuca TaxID=152965 RepID=A0A9P5MMR9_9AGAM|nr:RTA1-domain-containing protein [Russula ochroleuca]KAF8478891.1 RTA1-domain-containing protein [Russula ochroleuca]